MAVQTNFAQTSRIVLYVLGGILTDTKSLVVILGVLQPLDGVSLLARVAQL